MAKKKPVSADISKHVLVPKQKLLNEKEIKILLDQYKISSYQLPSMSIKDPMTKMLNAEVGSIIEIQRQSPVTGKYKYYRRVVG
ncbi:MAG: DNA-directed RNA polymerase subunit H [Candidatus Nanoarchaeia archaeon]|nr:DNA-directed RNA polymerase subunit H [Candidatus Nanoarchaeia archaeon]